MKIWQCKYEEFVNGDVITSIKQFDDSNILLDCVADSYDQMLSYMFFTCVHWCKSNELHMISFEIIAE